MARGAMLAARGWRVRARVRGLSSRHVHCCAQIHSSRSSRCRRSQTRRTRNTWRRMRSTWRHAPPHRRGRERQPSLQVLIGFYIAHCSHVACVRRVLWT
eukprot:251551-Prymnesium_polylepis.1